MLLLPLTLITSLSLLHTFVEGSFKMITVEDKSSLSPAEMLEKNNLANNDYSENPRVRNRAFKCSGGAQCSQSAQSGRAQEFECTDGSTCERQVGDGEGEQLMLSVLQSSSIKPLPPKLPRPLGHAQ